MPPLPGGSRPGRSSDCVVWKQRSSVRQRPRCVLSHARDPRSQPGSLFLPLLASLRCRVAHMCDSLDCA